MLTLHQKYAPVKSGNMISGHHHFSIARTAPYRHIFFSYLNIIAVQPSDTATNLN